MDDPHKKRQRSLSLEVEIEPNMNTGIPVNLHENYQESFDMSALLSSIQTLNITNKLDYNKIEGMLTTINSKLNKLDDIDKLELMIKKVERKFENIIREKDYEISNLKDEMDTLRFQLKEDSNVSNSISSYYT